MKTLPPHRKLLLPLMVAVAAIAAGCNDTPPERTSMNVSPPPPMSSPATPTDAPLANAGAAIGDAALTGKVKAAMIAEPGLQALAIDVHTRDRVVTLTGTVDTPVAKEKAIQLAGSIDGVASVVDRLTLKM